MSKPSLHPLAAFLLLFLGCAQHQPLGQSFLQTLDEFNVLVDEHVPDPDRAELVHSLMGQFRDLVQGFYDDHVDTRERFTRINRNYNAEPRDFETHLLRLQQSRVRTYRRITVLALQARTAIDREEWDAIHQDLRESRDR